VNADGILLTTHRGVTDGDRRDQANTCSHQEAIMLHNDEFQ